MPTYTQAREKTAEHLAHPPAVAKRRSPTILLIEDEHFLRVGVIKALKKKGFTVLEAGDGATALRLIRAHLGKIDVVLLDVMIPEVSSREVLENLRRLRPDLQVILTSAHSREMVDAAFAGLPVELFIRKPFQLIDLFSLLGNVLSKTDSCEPLLFANSEPRPDSVTRSPQKRSARTRLVEIRAPARPLPASLRNQRVRSARQSARVSSS